MVKALSFKGDKPKKRKRTEDTEEADLSKALTVAQQKEQDDNSDDLNWVSAEAVTDISGPVLLVLPTSPPSALATDAHGKVFASEIENIDESRNPSSAEPHDVRQVWIANRIAGTEKHSLKGHHSKYLGCDKYGVLSSLREAISAEESWTFVPAPEIKDGFAVQTQREGFVGVEQDESSGKGVGQGTKIRGDVEEIKFVSTVRVRMQARFKPKLRTAKAETARQKISRKELEDAVGRRLEDDEVKMLKRARRDGGYHEALLDVKTFSASNKKYPIIPPDDAAVVIA